MDDIEDCLYWSDDDDLFFTGNHDLHEDEREYGIYRGGYTVAESESTKKEDSSIQIKKLKDEFNENTLVLIYEVRNLSTKEDLDTTYETLLSNLKKHEKIKDSPDKVTMSSKVKFGIIELCIESSKMSDRDLMNFKLKRKTLHPYFTPNEMVVEFTAKVEPIQK